MMLGRGICSIGQGISPRSLRQYERNCMINQSPDSGGFCLDGQLGTTMAMLQKVTKIGGFWWRSINVRRSSEM
jgi:hypothetical protein